MQVKVFESEDMPTALRMIREELGPDALILSSRTVRKGGMGLFGKPMLEVTAAIDDDAGMESVKGSAYERSSSGEPRAEKPFSEHVDEAELSYAQIWRRQRVISAEENVASTLARGTYRDPDLGAAYGYMPEQKSAKRAVDTGYGMHNKNGDDYDVAQLRAELGSLRKMVGDLVEDLPLQLERLARPRIGIPHASTVGSSAAHRSDTSHGTVSDMVNMLEDYGIDGDTAQTIAHFVAGQLSASQLADKDQVQAFLRTTIADLVQTHGSIFPEQEGDKRRIALIGPTGVGKTTTIAKLAAAYLLAGGRKVALITIDTYRIAAVEQLKVYGEIMNLPVEVVVRPEQLEQVLARHQNKDLILIDTAGRSPRDSVSLDELETFLAVDPEIETHLVLSATTRDRDLGEIYKRFSALAPRSLLMTKLDECDGAGVLLNVHVRHNCPLSYVANGQKVPEDIVLLTPENVGDMILKSSEGQNS
ncbi:MAG: flagellar biosynthesis protein FlhF [Desulfuromonadaceae bacterium]|nr:flagellar biosynthesis protein FlhF [Desulfuromonadaceae bacterium]